MGLYGFLNLFIMNQPLQHLADINIRRTTRDTAAASGAGIKIGNLWKVIEFLLESITQPHRQLRSGIAAPGDPGKIPEHTRIPLATAGKLVPFLLITQHKAMTGRTNHGARPTLHTPLGLFLPYFGFIVSLNHSLILILMGNLMLFDFALNFRNRSFSNFPLVLQGGVACLFKKRLETFQSLPALGGARLDDKSAFHFGKVDIKMTFRVGIVPQGQTETGIQGQGAIGGYDQIIFPSAGIERIRAVRFEKT